MGEYEMILRFLSFHLFNMDEDEIEKLALMICNDNDQVYDRLDLLKDELSNLDQERMNVEQRITNILKAMNYHRKVSEEVRLKNQKRIDQCFSKIKNGE